VNYPSRTVPVEWLADEHLHRLLTTELVRSAPRVHFVTHSMGGLLVRQYLAGHTLANLGRVVMIGPPNQGSEVADRLRRWRLFRMVVGVNLARLGTTETDLPRQLPPVNFELGVIAGNRPLLHLGLFGLPRPHDGRVSVASTKVQGMRDHLELAGSHSPMIWKRSTGDQIAHFLRHGRFQR
jgi:pimeloyl-ACP methyl ester carboxylesterase